jgi:TonB family protein
MTKPRASTGNGDDGALKEFGLKISKRAGSQVRESDYPDPARRKGQEGTAQVKLTFGVDGKLKAVAVGGSTGYQILDERAVEILRRIEMPPVPDGRRGQEFTVQVPIVFKLKHKP